MSPLLAPNDDSFGMNADANVSPGELESNAAISETEMVLHTSNTAQTSSIGTAASSALSLLLQEDPLLIEHDMIYSKSRGANDLNDDVLEAVQSANVVNEEASFSYAASLLQDTEQDTSGWTTSTGDVQQRATEALAEVERKLALIQSLYLRIARENPLDVAGKLLKLHGHDDVLNSANNRETEQKEHQSNSLISTREQCDRLKRQSSVLEGVAKRVETSLEKGMVRMENTTSRLERVLELSSTLKMIMRLRFEAKKIQGSGILDTLVASAASSNMSNPYYASHMQVDLRDLTRAAASVAAMEELLQNFDNDEKKSDTEIAVVEKMRPQAKTVASAVRQAAAGLLAEQQQQQVGQKDAKSSTNTMLSSSKLGATLQVYFHLGELNQAVWSAVSQALVGAEKASSQFFNPAALQRMKEAATSEAKGILQDQLKNDRQTDEKKALEKLVKKKLREKRAEIASKWAAALGDASLKVWNLYHVLMKKVDPITRHVFLDVVFKNNEIPDKFNEAYVISTQQSRHIAGRADKNIFFIYWNQVCIGLGARIQRLLKYDGGSIARDVSALYPAVRSAALDMLVRTQDFQLQVGIGNGSNSSSEGLVSTGTNNAVGILGGSSCLEDALILENGFHSFGNDNNINDGAGITSGSNFMLGGADVWTHDSSLMDDSSNRNYVYGADNVARVAGPSQSSSSSVISSPEWKSLEGNLDYAGNSSRANSFGFYPLHKAFLEASSERLFSNLQYLFPEAVTVDENGNTVSVLPSLPSKYDVAKLDASIREELSHADPRVGGGELGMTTMICQNIVNMIERFCISASGAVSDVVDGTDGYLSSSDGISPTEALLHDRKLVNVLNSLSNFLRNASDKTFVLPYKPAVSPQHEEASRLCQISLLPALQEIDGLVKENILIPLCSALNSRISTIISKIHHGTYLENVDAEASPMDGGGSAFVQNHLNPLYDQIASLHLSKLPSEYAGIVSRIVATFSIYAFVSNISLVRPLGEMGRLRMVQDLADLELALEQLILKGGNYSITLSQIDGGRPYAELRAMRQMLFWNGLEDKNLTHVDISKNLLRENWIKDVRPSTIIHFLFSYAPNLLSSPHHINSTTSNKKRPHHNSAEEYVQSSIVIYNGTFVDCEMNAWMTTMACCEAYQQRESAVDSNISSGDKRIASILMLLGPELLRRRRQ